MNFKLIKKSSKSGARLGNLKTAHGVIKTPFFMPCATQGVVKTVSMLEMQQLKAQIILANTYHLMLLPGEKQVNKLGGLHKFINWQKPILTDSGGFQVFSLAGTKKKNGQSLVKLTRNGVKFKSYLDGKEYYLTPEKAIKIQTELGVDIATCLDVCIKLPAKQDAIKQSVELTTDWAQKAKNYYRKIISAGDARASVSPARQQTMQTVKPGYVAAETAATTLPLLFAVIQGGLNKELRLKSLADLEKISTQGGPLQHSGQAASGWDGYNIGGLSVGESEQEMYGVLDYLCPAMPENKPRYLMGVGYPDNIIEAVKRGIDMFDCVIPTREGRHGRIFYLTRSSKPEHSLLIGRELRRGKKGFYHIININRAKFKNDQSAINLDSKLPELREYSKAYLHYLFKIKEPLGARLASLNNLEFYLDLMKEIRYAIKSGKL